MSSSYTDARIHFKPDPDNTDESNLLLSIFTNDDDKNVHRAVDEDATERGEVQVSDQPFKVRRVELHKNVEH